MTRVVALAVFLAGVTTSASASRTHDIVCGPRAVQFILEWYGKSVDLDPLIRETQWPAIEKGASLKSLAESLADRGVHVAVLRIPPGAPIAWPHPVLIHLNEESASQGGHFVVWVPRNEPGGSGIWDGSAGYRVVSAEWLAERWSGFVLLTSPEPIDNPSLAVNPGVGWQCAVLQSSAVVAAGALAWTCLRRRPHRRRCVPDNHILEGDQK